MRLGDQTSISESSPNAFLKTDDVGFEMRYRVLTTWLWESTGEKFCVGLKKCVTGALFLAEITALRIFFFPSARR